MPNFVDIGTLQNAATANGAGSVSDDLTGYDGTVILCIKNGAGSCTVTPVGYDDSTFALTQNKQPLALMLLASSLGTSGSAATPTLNLSRALVSNVISVIANTTYWYAVVDGARFIQAPITSASSLGAGQQNTGCTVSLYSVSV